MSHDNTLEHRSASFTPDRSARSAAYRTWAAYVAEGLGTFALVFVGCGAIMIDTLSHGSITHIGVVLVFGLIITVMIYTFGHISWIGNLA